ncbi:regulatory LuxR family protein [Pseudobacter ginsenosidimutans]|uniref:Regulatory LuxR family protein n=2 Tax=Pseudobacter ginsenosidimutans TaxID=661488 RepID=A0A4Q7MZY4_9BACT|nr:regulatory LuxR family protein [Pseudobacter ginsenosidimutans]
MLKDNVLLEQIHTIIRDHFFSTHNFIHYLYQHFPDLLGNAVQANVVKQSLRDYKIAAQPEMEPVERHAPFEPAPVLTRREKEVLGLLAEGLCAKEIAQILFISETTVVTHKKNLKNKFKVKNTVELVSKVYSHIK